MSEPPIPYDAERGIFYSSEEIDFALAGKKKTSEWLQRVIEQEENSLHLLNFIFCSDNYLHHLNVKYLGHDNLTDVITFPYEKPPAVAGDIFISIDRVRENAADFKTSFEHELNRVMVHGILHLCGYGDKTKEEKKLMREKEDAALALKMEKNL